MFYFHFGYKLIKNKSNFFVGYLLLIFGSFFLLISLILGILFFSTNYIYDMKTNYPLVVLTSNQMEHKIINNQICDKIIKNVNDKKISSKDYWNLCGNYYEKEYNISESKFNKFKYPNGLNVRDLLIIKGIKSSQIKIGDVIVFKPNNDKYFVKNGPVLHRVVNKWQDEKGIYHFQTKGDHNPVTYKNFEENITNNNIFGVVENKIPYLGYFKILN